MSHLKFLTVREAAERMNYTQKYVRDLLYENKLPGAGKTGRRWQIPLVAVEAHLKRQDSRGGTRK